MKIIADKIEPKTKYVIGKIYDAMETLHYRDGTRVMVKYNEDDPTKCMIKGHSVDIIIHDDCR